jgi:hypothetical protein
MARGLEYVHGLLLLYLSRARLRRILADTPNMDLRPLLSGTEGRLTIFIAGLADRPDVLLHALPTWNRGAPANAEWCARMGGRSLLARRAPPGSAILALLLGVEHGCLLDAWSPTGVAIGPKGEGGPYVWGGVASS